jgi:hypothetical protein
MITQALEALARDFWAGVNGADTFPRDIEQAAPLQLPLPVIPLTPLTLQAVADWLCQRGLVMPVLHEARQLYGCLVAHRGRGVIFVSADDSPEERRLTVAHEVAHFLVDYLLPRRQVMQVFGPEAAEVLDGERPPTPAERAAAILAHVRLGPHVHLLPRSDADADGERRVFYAEDRANRLALELVAPQARVRQVLDNLSAHRAVGPEAACSALAQYFGLPVYVFEDPVRRLVQGSPPSFVADILAGLRRQR